MCGLKLSHKQIPGYSLTEIKSYIAFSSPLESPCMPILHFHYYQETVTILFFGLFKTLFRFLFSIITYAIISK